MSHPMLRMNTPIQDYRKRYGLWVKREDLSCFKPGPPFSKTRGVYAHVKRRPEKLIGVLDTSHSQAGHAVARACQLLGKKCVNFYPRYKADKLTGLRENQLAAKRLGARLKPLLAGRSCILFHSARKLIESEGGYMMPNALKLKESVEETAKEVGLIEEETDWNQILIPISSGTIAAGVMRGFLEHNWDGLFIIHLGYSRSHDQVRKYLEQASGYAYGGIQVVDENYSYKDKARPGLTPPFPCNEYYDLKAFRWWIDHRRNYEGETLFWNIG